MDNIQFQSYAIEDRSYVSFIKREIHNLVRPKFSETRTGEIDIVISELASNLIKHVGRGEILYRLGAEVNEPVFEIICIDNGCGMKDVSYSIRDGVSTKNTLGHGLGSVLRLSSLAQIYSQPDWGTIVYCKFYNNPEFQSPKGNVQLRCINLAMPGEKVSGDGMHVRFLKDKTLLLFADGLGHGEHAKHAVDKACEIFETSMNGDPSEILRELNSGIKKTRGLVASVVVLDHKNKLMQICGIGNILTRVHRGLESKNYIPNNGIVGLNIPGRIENAQFELEKMQQVIFCSDGIKTKWDLIRYQGILKYDPMMLAAVIYKDHARKTDDMTIAIAKII